jgi:hypothetical protein
MSRTGCISGLGTCSERGSGWWWKGREDEWGRCEGVVQNAETVAGWFENASAGWCSEGKGKEGANQSRAMIHSPLSTTPFALACIEIAHRHHRCTSNTLLTCEDVTNDARGRVHLWSCGDVLGRAGIGIGCNDETCGLHVRFSLTVQWGWVTRRRACIFGMSRVGFLAEVCYIVWGGTGGDAGMGHLIDSTLF